MGAISVRLPDQLESRLATEAEIEGKGRSEVARDAIADYLTRREQERFMAEMVAEARAAYATDAIRHEAVETSEAFQALEAEPTSNTENDEKWWK